MKSNFSIRSRINSDTKAKQEYKSSKRQFINHYSLIAVVHIVYKHKRLVWSFFTIKDR